MKIAYVTDYDSTDIKNWSGTGYYIPKWLIRTGHDVDYIGNLKMNGYLREKVKKKGYKYMMNKEYATARSPRVLSGYARQILQRMDPGTDVLFGPSSLPFSLLETDKPIVFWTDAVFASMVNFYPLYSGFCR